MGHNFNQMEAAITAQINEAKNSLRNEFHQSLEEKDLKILQLNESLTTQIATSQQLSTRLDVIEAMVNVPQAEIPDGPVQVNDPLPSQPKFDEFLLQIEEATAINDKPAFLGYDAVRHTIPHVACLQR